MKESVGLLFKKMNEDKAFAERILSQTEMEKVLEVAQEEGIALTLEDIDDANAIIAKALEKQNEGELSEEELENVAGGIFDWVFVISASLTLLAAAMSGAATASVGATVTISVAAENKGK